MVGPCLPGLQLATWFSFSTLAVIDFKSLEQVIPFTLKVRFFTVSAGLTDGEDCEKENWVVNSIDNKVPKAMLSIFINAVFVI